MTVLDTAWARFQKQEGLGRTPPLGHFMATLAKTCVGFNLDPATPALALEMTSFADQLTREQTVASVLLLMTTLTDVAQGSTRTPIDGPAGEHHLQERFGRLLEVGEAPEEFAESVALVQTARQLLAQNGLAHLVGATESAYTPLIYLDGWLVHQRLQQAESRLANALCETRSTADSADSVAADAAVQSIIDAPAGFSLSDEQEHAVRRAVSDRLLFISGGPGTGKTSIVVAILRTMARLGVHPKEVAMAAPTGKAAWRMGESVAAGLAAVETPSAEDLALMSDLPAPQTLHRLLEYSPKADRFGRGAEVHLEETLVVIDETSMVDVYLMERLLAASGPDTRLVFLGDADQLPSVAAGAVFRDAVSGLRDRQVRLTKSFRMRRDNPAGAAILQVAMAINEGSTHWLDTSPSPIAEVSTVLVSTPRRAGVGVADPEGEPLDLFLDQWFAEHVRGAQLDAARRHVFEPVDDVFDEGEHQHLANLFQHTGAARLLCATRVAPEGTVMINQYLHLAMARAMEMPSTTQFLPGEPVLMLRNDYRRQVFNGDQGVVVRLRRGSDVLLGIVFPGRDGPRAFALDPLVDRIEHCYGMTIHKSQGSEFDHVALILPRAPMPLMSRELLYTGVTRSRTSVNLIGPREVLVDAISSPLCRTSGLSDRLERSRESKTIATKDFEE